MLRKILFTLFACLALGPWGAPWGQAYPNKPVRVIVPFGPGGPDAVARILGAQLSIQTGQSFVIENKPGANGILGAESLAKSAPDGYTFMITSSGFVTAPSMYRKLPYDTEKDFAPVTNLVENPGIFVAVNPGVPVRSLQELIDLGRKPESKLSFGSPGVGNTLHLSGALFNARAGTNLLHIPYKGAGPAVAAAMSGETQVMFSTPPAVLAQLRAGKLRALAYSDSKRHPLLPDVPTAAEAGLPSYQHHGGWFGMFAPANTPAEILNRIQGEVRKAFANAQFRERLDVLGADPVADAPADFKLFVSAEIKRYAEMVRLAGIQPE
ncbi:MAG: tripartite tricarboxylate transporter substrate binding protein [Betaproteobacteria bacterium]|nr:tripartite tricarboxylate transporter substrate binding protein [Betaproteobacteria bacterium]